VSEPEVRAGLALLADARAEVEQLETAMLFTARSLGLSWAQISREMGLGSAQAAVQRFDRLMGRVEGRERR
jgi:cyanate lyase